MLFTEVIFNTYSNISRVFCFDKIGSLFYFILNLSSRLESLLNYYHHTLFFRFTFMPYFTMATKRRSALAWLTL